MWTTFNSDGDIHVVVETPRGSAVKLKYDPSLTAFTLSRPLTLGTVYPHDWGFIPSTRAADGDPIDAMVLWDGTSFPGIVLATRAIGLLRVEQTNVASGARERNDRLFVLPIKAPRHEHVRTIFDVPERVRQELEQFFITVVAFEGKELRLLGFDGPSAADRYLRDALTTPQ
jgi:inorganic pyrophosphatase